MNLRFLSVILFYFPLSILFFSYILLSYRTLLITVLFNRTDRLSFVNICVIIIITNSREIETYQGCCGMLPGDMLFLHSSFISVSYRLKSWLHLESGESGGALKTLIVKIKWVKNDVERTLIKEILSVSSSPSCYGACSTFGNYF